MIRPSRGVVWCGVVPTRPAAPSTTTDYLQLSTTTIYTNTNTRLRQICHQCRKAFGGRSLYYCQHSTSGRGWRGVTNEYYYYICKFPFTYYVLCYSLDILSLSLSLSQLYFSLSPSLSVLLDNWCIIVDCCFTALSQSAECSHRRASSSLHLHPVVRIDWLEEPFLLTQKWTSPPGSNSSTAFWWQAQLLHNCLFFSPFS